MRDRDKSFLQLLMRLPDTGDGWRQVSEILWPLVARFSAPELLECDRQTQGGRVRLSENGLLVTKYLS